ncbi:MAG TPA: FAD-binding oxidoreductase [Candidatus Nesterenkonia stercoripullorum]|uniref:FAD-binding oxidoreductase n=1 Tax=Candidatus Nesterenkonia stercoripullorum TaxID=2838701 RepID=A0A9D1S335_9MICC|nr:FAD-binding oxidoreductase [Candidatus Nesterenkonia stercoripullorum]
MHATAPASPAQSPQQPDAGDSEFVIVGGGGYGCAVAYHLAKAGRSVQLLEAGELAQQASGGRGKRGVRGNRRDMRELALMREAYEIWPDLAGELGADTGYLRTGGLTFIEEDVVGMSGGLVAAHAHARAQSASGVPTEVWDADRVRAELLGVSSGMKAGLYAPLDGVASQRATTLAYAAAARAHGAVIRENTPVVGLNGGQQPGAAARHAPSVTTDSGERIEATESVLLACNAAVPGLLRDHLDVDLPAWTVYPQVVWLRPENPMELPVLLGHESRTLSVKMEEDGVIMLSGGWQGRKTSGHGAPQVVEEQVEGNIEQLRAVFPELGELQRLEVDVSRAETATVDHVPIIDAVPGARGMYIATAWSGHGWALVPAASRHIADLVAGKGRSDALMPFGLSRFGITDA